VHQIHSTHSPILRYWYEINKFRDEVAIAV